MVAQISVPVSNVVSLIGLGFTRLEIWHAPEGSLQFEELTDSAASAATLDSIDASTLFRMGGRTIKVIVNGGVSQTIDFSSMIDYWTPTQVATRINEVVASLTSVVGNKIRLTSPTTGRASSLLIEYSDAEQLGLPAGSSSNGKDARLTLGSGTVIYQYVDPIGRPNDNYKWRFSANGVSPISDFSSIVPGKTRPIAAIPLSIAMATFVGIDGRAKKTTVIFAQDSAPLVVSGYGVGQDHSMTVDSDDLGFLQVPLVQGAVVRVAIEGTTYVREITVPTTATFDLLAALSTAPDPFTVKVPAPFLTRRSI